MMGNGVQSDTGTRGEGERVAVPGKVHPPGNALPDPGAPTRAPRPVCPGARRRHGGPGVPQEHAVLPADQPEHGRGAERCGALPPSTGRAGAPSVAVEGPRGASAENPKCHKKGLFQSTGAHKEKESALHIGCSGFGMKIEFSILQWPQFLLSAHWQASFFFPSGLGCIFQLFWGSLFFCRGKEVTVLGMMLVVLVVVVVVGHSHL